jgi:ectoine hydroxylase-related dioxygenase (phytanoyl-CoA dioxygenase family)
MTAAKRAVTPLEILGQLDFAALERDGAVCVRGLLTDRWLADASSMFDALKAGGRDLSRMYDEPAPGQTIVRDDCWIAQPKFLQFLHESPLAGAAASLLGTERIHLYEDLLIYKSAGAEQPTPWHQDEPQWPLCGRQMLSGWFCLDPVNPQTGSLRFAKSTHRGPLYRPFVTPDRREDLAEDERFFDGGALPDVEGDPKRFPLLTFSVAPGDVIFFHPRVLHAALGSAPSWPRRTFSIRFLGDDVRWLPKKSVFHDWLKDITLVEGERISGPRFPQLWPPRAAEPAVSSG